MIQTLDSRHQTQRMQCRRLSPKKSEVSFAERQIITDEGGKVKTKVGESDLELWVDEAFLLGCLYIPVLSAKSA